MKTMLCYSCGFNGQKHVSCEDKCPSCFNTMIDFADEEKNLNTRTRKKRRKTNKAASDDEVHDPSEDEEEKDPLTTTMTSTKTKRKKRKKTNKVASEDPAIEDSDEDESFWSAAPAVCLQPFCMPSPVLQYPIRPR